MGLTGSEAWRGKRERVPGGRGASRRRGPGEKVRKRRGSAGQSAGRCCWSVWKAASDYHELKGRAQGLRVRESRAASGESGIVKQRGPRVAPESWEGGILEVEAGVRSRGYSRLVVRAVRFRLGVGQWELRGRSWLEFSTVLAPLGRIRLLAFVQEPVSSGAGKEPAWPGL